MPLANGSPRSRTASSDGTITFQVTRESGDNKFVMKYNGKLAGDTIEGKAEGEREGQAFSLDWKAKREKEKQVKRPRVNPCTTSLLRGHP